MARAPAPPQRRRPGSSTPSKRSRGTGAAPAGATRSGATRAGTARSGADASKGRAPRERTGGGGRQREGTREVAGVALLVLAVLSALALWGGEEGRRAGLLGEGLWLAFRGLLGVLALAVPLGLVATGVALLRGRRPAHVRVALGVALVALAAAGLVHLWQGSPSLSAPVEVLHRAAGWVGAGVALPLAALTGGFGAAVVLVALAVIGAVLGSGIPPAVAVAATSEALRATRDLFVERRARHDLSPDPDPALEVEGDSVPDTNVAPVRRSHRRAPLSEASDSQAGELVVSYDGVGDGPEVDDGSSPGEDAALSDTRLLPRDLDVSRPAPALPESGPVRGPVPDDLTLDLDSSPAEPGGEVPDGTRLAPPADDWSAYELPPLALLRPGRVAPGNRRALDAMREALESTLRQFGVAARVTRVSRGPTVTRFELALEPGVKVSSVTKLEADLAYALATAEIRIVAPIPGKSAIGIEVPNRDRDLITLGDVLRSPEAEAQAHPLTAGIGVDIAGNPVLVNLARMPHVLIAGATGSGKSVTMNGIVTSLIMRSTPAQVRLVLVDPKRVELTTYDGVPHLLTPVVTDPKRAVEALEWTVKEMNDRYERLSLLGYRNLDGYNDAVREGTVRQAPALSGKADADWGELPYIVFVIDELADLMMTAARDVEAGIVRIAQMARAVGIHLVVATQRPSVDVVTGLIKANIPSRIALAMATGHDSKTILDAYGAEKLVGGGDMLYLPANASKPHRIQGCYLDETEVEQVVAHTKAQRHAEFAEGIVKDPSTAAAAEVTGDEATDADLIRAARDLVVRSGLGSTSMLQRKLRIGFARAGRVMDELEQLGVVGPSEGSKARAVLMTVDQLDADDRWQ